MRWLASALVAAALALGGCGRGEGGVSGDATKALQPHVAQVRAAAAAGNAGQLGESLAALGTAVDILKSEGKLTADAAADILKAAEAVQQQAALITTTTVKPPPTTARVVERDEHGGDGKGGDKKRGGGDDGD